MPSASVGSGQGAQDPMVSALEITGYSTPTFKLATARLGTTGTRGNHTISVARDLGSSIELAGGITKNDRIIDSPPDGIVNGDQVRVAAAPAANKGKT